MMKVSTLLLWRDSCVCPKKRDINFWIPTLQGASLVTCSSISYATFCPPLESLCSPIFGKLRSQRRPNKSCMENLIPWGASKGILPCWASRAHFVKRSLQGSWPYLLEFPIYLVYLNLLFGVVWYLFGTYSWLLFSNGGGSFAHLLLR